MVSTELVVGNGYQRHQLEYTRAIRHISELEKSRNSKLGRMSSKRLENIHAAAQILENRNNALRTLLVDPSGASPLRATNQDIRGLQETLDSIEKFFECIHGSESGKQKPVFSRQGKDNTIEGICLSTGLSYRDVIKSNPHLRGYSETALLPKGTIVKIPKRKTKDHEPGHMEGDECIALSLSPLSDRNMVAKHCNDLPPTQGPPSTHSQNSNDCLEVYLSQKGDSLEKIATLFGSNFSLDRLLEYNQSLAERYRVSQPLPVGLRVMISLESDPCAPGSKKGKTLVEIANTLHCSVDDLRTANSMLLSSYTSHETLPVGLKLVVPKVPKLSSARSRVSDPSSMVWSYTPFAKGNSPTSSSFLARPSSLVDDSNRSSSFGYILTEKGDTVELLATEFNCHPDVLYDNNVCVLEEGNNGGTFHFRDELPADLQLCVPIN